MPNFEPNPSSSAKSRGRVLRHPVLIAASVIATIQIGSLLLDDSAGVDVSTVAANLQAEPESSASTELAPTTELEPTTAPATTVPVEVREVLTTEPIPFSVEDRDDPLLDFGLTTIVQPGQPGVRTITHKVTFKGDQEVGRRLVSEAVTVGATPQIVAHGTYVAPTTPPTTTTEVPAPQGLAGGGCDPNYSGCVPIASDVDCAGGKGNGPAYVSGPVQVIGADIYDLDRDSDGYGCE